MQDIVDAALMDAKEAASVKKPNDQPQNQLLNIVALRSRSGGAACISVREIQDGQECGVDGKTETGLLI